MERLTFPLTDPIAIFAVLLLVAVLTPFVLRPLRIPAVVGLIFGGMLVGPQVLGVIQQGAIPELMGKIGIIYIMFLAGIEIDIHQLNRRKGETVAFGLLTFLIPLAFGFFGGRAFGLDLVPALLLASMFSSYTLLTYPDVSRFGLAKNRAVTIAVGAIVVSDVAALLILAVIGAFSTGNLDHLYGLRLFGLITLYALGVFFVLPFLTRKALKFLSTKDDIQFLVVFALLFLVSFLAAPAGLEPVIGAFLCGIALNRLIPDTSILMNRLKFVGNTIFIPLFMVYVGLLINPGSFVATPGSWAFAAFMALAALTAKAISALLAGMFNKFTRAEGWLMFGMTVNHAAVTLAVALTGKKLGLFDDTILTATIIMILVTCVTGSLVTDRAARRVKLEDRDDTAGQTRSTKRIMVSLANPDTASNLAELAAYIVQPGVTEALYPTAVVQEGPQSDERLAKAEALLAAASSRLALHHLDAFPVTGLDVNIASGLMRVSRARRANLIILGWNGNYNVGRSLFGSVLDQVVSQSQHRLMVAKLDGGLEGLSSLTLMLPPLAEHLDDLGNTLQHPFDLARALGLRLRVLGQAATLKACALLFQDYQKTRPLETRTVAEWSDLVPALQDLSGPDDILCLCSVRKNQLSWQPSMEKLPKRLSELFPANRLLVLYPAIHADAATDPEAEHGPTGNLVYGLVDQGHPAEAGLSDRSGAIPFGKAHPARLSPTLQAVPDSGPSGQTQATPGPTASQPDTAPLPALKPGLPLAHSQFSLDSAAGLIGGIRSILASRYAPGRVDDILKALDQTGGLQPVELSTGVVLIHYHADDCADFWVGLGTWQPALGPDDGGEPIHTLCLLISPTSLGPEAHLKALSSLARWVVKGGI